ncbi:hypothetical protein HPB50_003996 [Hyalomma asiaticum]|uniref:Uncharacterized protein n=1 Tax=Hyalomma asiaticum TaxID=266040 RepID=A0ACB7ST36_HYAAI|nr:hypothetical protein HPB50_003996 [Hyalomma asiaticum]
MGCGHRVQTGVAATNTRTFQGTTDCNWDRGVKPRRLREGEGDEKGNVECTGGAAGAFRAAECHAQKPS